MLDELLADAWQTNASVLAYVELWWRYIQGILQANLDGDTAASTMMGTVIGGTMIGTTALSAGHSVTEGQPGDGHVE